MKTDAGKIDFSKLWEWMEKKHYNKQYLVNNGIHKSTLYKLVRNDTVTTDTICRLCYLLKCKPGQIMDYIQPGSEETELP